MPIFRKRTALKIARGVRAFLSLEAGLTRGEIPHEAVKKQLASQSREISALKRELSQTRGAEGGWKSPVFFVVGHKKSGTTWLMKMLDAHPEILCGGEGRFFGREWRQEKLKELQIQQQPASLYNSLANAEDLRLWIERSPWSRHEDAEEHLSNLTGLAVDYFLSRRLAQSGKKMIGDKSPLLTPEDVKEISTIYPGAKIIHIIRDGRDAAVSATHHVWNFSNVGVNKKISAKREAYRQSPGEALEEGIFAGGQLRNAAREWGSRVGRAAEDGAALLGESYAEVRYEDLLEWPAAEMERLAGFLGARTDDEAVRGCVEAASFENLSEGRKRGEEDETSFFRKGVAGDWKNVFTRRDRRVFKQEAGELLIRLGYERDSGW